MSCACNFGTGLSTCHCAGCHQTFTSVTAFDKHQEIQDGRVICTAPATLFRRDGTTPVFAVIRETPDGSPVWGQHYTGVPRFAVKAGISDRPGGSPVSSPRAA